jgi:hypothetical protein
MPMLPISISVNQFLWRAADFVDGIQVVVPEMHLVHLPQGHRLNLGPVDQRHLARPGQGGVQAFGVEFISHIFSGDRFESSGLPVVDHEIADPLPLFRRQSLDREAGSLRDVLILISREHLMRLQPFQGVGTDQKREIGELLDEGLVVPPLFHENFGNAEEDGGIR